MQYILSDNGANVKRALLDLGKLEVTAKDEPLICGDDDADLDDDDVWTKFVPGPPSIANDQEPGPSSLGLSCPLSSQVRDEFLPIPLDEVDENAETIANVDLVLNKLQDNFTSIVKNPRMHSLTRLPCFCHLLQVI